VQRRIARNRLLADATFRCAACAINASPGARRYYLANKLTGILHGCLRERRLYDEANAWAVQLHEEAA